MQLVVHFCVTSVDSVSTSAVLLFFERATDFGLKLPKLVKYLLFAKQSSAKLFDNLWKMIGAYVLPVYRRFDLETRLRVHAWARRVYLSRTIARIYLNSL